MGPSLVQVDNHVGEIPFSTVPSGTISGHARVAVWQFNPGMGEALSERVRTEMMPLLAQQPGFTGYGVARTGENSAVSVSAFASEEQAQAAAGTIGAWVQEHAMPSVASVERYEGEIIWDATAA